MKFHVKLWGWVNIHVSGVNRETLGWLFYSFRDGPKIVAFLRNLKEKLNFSKRKGSHACRLNLIIEFETCFKIEYQPRIFLGIIWLGFINGESVELCRPT